MPVVFRHRGCRFFFFSNEGDPLEPVHIHVRCGERLAKFWIDPQVELAESYGFSASDLNKIGKLVVSRSKSITRKWNDYFNL